MEDKLAVDKGTTGPGALRLEEVEVRPREGDLEVGDPILLWLPFLLAADGGLEAAFS